VRDLWVDYKRSDIFDLSVWILTQLATPWKGPAIRDWCFCRTHGVGGGTRTGQAQGNITMAAGLGEWQSLLQLLRRQTKNA